MSLTRRAMVLVLSLASSVGPAISAGAGPTAIADNQVGASNEGGYVNVWRENISLGGGAPGEEVALEPPGPARELNRRDELARMYARSACLRRGNCPPEADGRPAEEQADITARDIASFVPEQPGASSEPPGFSLVGVPTNFIMTGREHVVGGTLLGAAAEVRFVPAGSHWAHSDGGVVDSESLGARWADLGQADFSPTSTSYRYRSAGTFTVTTLIDYRAEYRFSDEPWKPVRGLITAPGPTLTIRVFAGHSALVDRLCTADPQAAGCRGLTRN